MLFSPVDARPLGAFRILFGIIVALQFYTFWESDFIGQGILAPAMLFTYDWLPFLKPLPPAGMKLVLAITLAAPLMLAFGKWPRLAAGAYVLSFSYLFLLEESYFNNHFYFIILLAAFFLFYQPRQQGPIRVIPRWLLLLFQVQVFIVYFYGGIAKLNTDWLVHQQPVRTLLELNAGASPFPGLTAGDFAVYYLTYGGLAFDLAIGFMLFWRRTFTAAVILTLVFHISNFWIFNFGEGGSIGIFPMLMMGANVLFARPELLRRWQERLNFNSIRKKTTSAAHSPAVTYRAGWAFSLLVVFVALQLLLPLRHLLVPGRTDWTGQQQWFSWRMKVSAKKVSALFILRRFEGDEPVTVDPKNLLNSMQANMMAQHADMIHKFVQYLKNDLHDRLGIEKAIIRADIKVSFNGRPVQSFVDPSKNLFDVEYRPWGHNDWIMDLEDNIGPDR